MSFGAMHHVSIGVADLERSVAFYADLLGFRPVLTVDVDDDGHRQYLGLGPEAHGRATALRRDRPPAAGITLVEITDPSHEARRPARPGDRGAFLIAFEVFDQDLDALAADLREAGHTLVSEPVWARVDNGRIRAVAVEDPDGFVVELYVTEKGTI